MSQPSITDKDRARAEVCKTCIACKRARKYQRGFWYWLVKRVEGSICPWCKAYEKVYGRKPHEPLPEDTAKA